MSDNHPEQQGIKVSTIVGDGVMSAPSDEAVNNLALWNQVCNTEESTTKEVEYGKRRFTAIDASYQRKRATSMWGPYGTSWGLRDCRWGYVPSEGEPRELWLEAMFFWLGGDPFHISSDIRWEAGKDCRKKLQTDVLTKALSYLGFNADVFEGRFDDNKYVASPKTDTGEETAAKAVQAITEATDVATVDKYEDAIKRRGLKSYHVNLVVEAANSRRSILQQEESFQ